MSEDRLSALTLMRIKKEVTKYLGNNIEGLVTQFADSTNRRLTLH